MSNTTAKLLSALIVAITATLVTQPMRAGAIDTLVITEFSSTSLTATLNNNPQDIFNVGPDSWSILLSGLSIGDSSSWTEPGAPGLSNLVFCASPATITVISDQTGGGAHQDGETDSTFTLNGNQLNVTFFDKGDVATVPDTGMTGSLLGLSLTGVAFLRRKLSRHLAA